MGTWSEAREKHLAEVKRCAEELNILSTEIATVAILNKLGDKYIRGYTDIRYCDALGQSCGSNDIGNYSHVIGLPHKPPLVEIKLSPSKIIVIKFLHLIPESNSMNDITTCVECQHLKKKMEELFIMKAVVDYSTNTAFTLEFKQGDLND